MELNVSKRGHIPVRMCVGCHRRRRKKELIRLVKGSDGMFFFDKKAETAERGHYLCPDLTCWKMAQKKIKGLGPLEWTAANDERCSPGTERPL